jgi:hypothetical protein
MAEEGTASLWGKRTLELAILGVVEAAMWALIEDFPTWAKIGTIVVGLLIIGSLNVKLGRFTKILPWLLGLIYLSIATVALVRRHPAQKVALTKTETGCEIWKQQSPLHAVPMPEKASDQQLMSEGLTISQAIINFQTLEMIIQRQRLCGLSEADAKSQDCSILQEYESNLRLPAQAIRGEMLNRLPIESRVGSYTSEASRAYSQPKDVDDISKVAKDLLRLVHEIEKKDGIEAKETKTQWIVPIPKKIEQAPYKECDTVPVQSVSLNGCTAELRGIDRSSGLFGDEPNPTWGSYSFLVLMKCQKLSHNYSRVRVYFHGNLHVEHSDNQSGATIGDDYIEFPTAAMWIEPSIEITTRDDIKIRKIVSF